jgi:hypothetical protein
VIRIIFGLYFQIARLDNMNGHKIRLRTADRTIASRQFARSQKRQCAMDPNEIDAMPSQQVAKHAEPLVAVRNMFKDQVVSALAYAARDAWKPLKKAALAHRQSKFTAARREEGNTLGSRRWSIEMFQNGFSILACSVCAMVDLTLLEGPCRKMLSLAPWFLS